MHLFYAASRSAKGKREGNLRHKLGFSGKWLVWLLVIGLIASSGMAYADTLTQSDLYTLGINYSDVNDSDCSTDTGSTNTSTGVDTPKWQTILQPPYSLEDFVVEVLRDIAAKEGVPETNTVTQQHVLAMVAFAWGEGGNITNNDIYNPWNTGYTGSDLQPVGGHASNGVQSYGSFNDGVEATARVMTGTGGSNGYQSRLGTTLKDPDSTAQQFMHALTYYQNYKGNLEWAEASMPPHQDSYYKERLGYITDTQNEYTKRASTLIGPPGESLYKNLTSNHSLRYIFTGDTSTNSGAQTTSTDNTCSGAIGAVAGNILATAENYAWHDNYDRPDPSCNPIKTSDISHYPHSGVGCSNDAYKQGWDGASDPTDCGAFVASVMINSGVDKNYPKSGTSVQEPYLHNHPDKWQIIVNPTLGSLQPGDVLIYDDGNDEGHTMIYAGSTLGGGYVAIDASWHDHVPQYRPQASVVSMLGKPNLTVARAN